MDQIVVHLSLNHATFPRIQNFLSNLQIGYTTMHGSTAQSHIPAPKTHSNTALPKDRSPEQMCAPEDGRQPNEDSMKRLLCTAWNNLYNHLTGGPNRTPNISGQSQ